MLRLLVHKFDPGDLQRGIVVSGGLPRGIILGRHHFSGFMGAIVMVVVEMLRVMSRVVNRVNGARVAVFAIALRGLQFSQLFRRG